MKVVVLDDHHRAFVNAAAVKRLRERAGVEVTVLTETVTGEALADALRGVDAVVALRERTRFDAAFFAMAPNLKLIAQTGGGINHVDVAAANAAGVIIAAAPAASSSATPELTIGLMIALMRRIPQTDRKLRAGEWDQISGQVLEGKTLGLVGLGRVGTPTAQLARAFGMKLLAWSRNMTPERAAEVGATSVPLDELLQTADIVSVHLSLTAETRGMISEEKLRLIRPNAYLINTARGAIVDEAALARLLAEGAIAGAALDVFTEEPLSPESPLLKLDNVVLTPHLGWPTDSAYAGFSESAVQRIEEFLDGGPSAVRRVLVPAPTR
ncbi:MAG: D-2-hydroxyacid dehydrogenase family protein [Chloroflexi bacterium]|nr:D-2-hydroxyacid dehydrogenase family protein [Chloroflexota bacterium]